MAPDTFTPAVGVVCHSKARAGLRRSPQNLHTRTRVSSLLILNLDSLLKSTWFHSAAVQLPRARLHSKRQGQHT
ncbi:e3 ubiquitin-protein ligase RNF13 [Trichonephila clavipes]|nr:e3 ubiquitin-protein ligase RNF13 [Trichonephila clavipes]